MDDPLQLMREVMTSELLSEQLAVMSPEVQAGGEAAAAARKVLGPPPTRTEPLVRDGTGAFSPVRTSTPALHGAVSPLICRSAAAPRHPGI